MVEQMRKTERAKELYAQRKETVERVFADAKDTLCVIHTTGAWLQLRDGSGLNMLP